MDVDYEEMEEENQKMVMLVSSWAIFLTLVQFLSQKEETRKEFARLEKEKQDAIEKATKNMQSHFDNQLTKSKGDYQKLMKRLKNVDAERSSKHNEIQKFKKRVEELEKQHPGITKVKKNQNGAVIIDDE